jgi:hypothetical protein
MNLYLKIVVIPLIVALFSSLGWFGFGCTVAIMVTLAYVEEKVVP